MAFGDMGQIMQQAQKLQKEMKQVQEELKKRIVLGEAGGGTVKAYVSGAHDVVKLEIDRSVVDPNEVGILEDLLLLAVKNGIEKSRELSQKEMSRVTGGLSLPGMF
ncbi:MAG: YbaB/EbfC family nucleoid-associated protein [Planctomycetes bacterium]|nr:YbaB/EbfC family nucleoid-associated protein [Planctomycetota bacterium]